MILPTSARTSRVPDVQAMARWRFDIVTGLSAQPWRVAFFDDSLGSVEGARAVGMTAYQATSVAAIRGHLAALGVLTAGSGAPGV